MLFPQTKNKALHWGGKDKKRNTFLDVEIAQAKKDCKVAPNHYFKIPKKGDTVGIAMFKTDEMYTTKKHRVSQLPKVSMIDQIQKTEK